MAADRKVVDGDVCYYVKKIKEVNGDFIGAGGNSSACTKFLIWYGEGADPDDLPKFNKEEVADGFDAIVLTKDGRILVYEKACLPEELECDFWAIGSGRQAALAAMHLGHGPLEALEVTREIDHNTGGKIDVLELEG